LESILKFRKNGDQRNDVIQTVNLPESGSQRMALSGLTAGRLCQKSVVNISE
jgi:hypothetical protein